MPRPLPIANGQAHTPLIRIARSLAITFAPHPCALCDRPGQFDPWCNACAPLLSHPSLCPRCGTPAEPPSLSGCRLCRDQPTGFNRIIPLGPYDSALRSLCLKLKKPHGAWLLPWIADLYLQSYQKTIESLPVDAIIPIPSHWTRRWQLGGHHPAHSFAKILANRLDLPFLNLLKRTRPTKRLYQLSAAERRRELRGAFALQNPNHSAPPNILLVDDILTTGATCRAALAVLKKAGAKHASVAILARAHKAQHNPIQIAP